jgi:hypothetical protein
MNEPRRWLDDPDAPSELRELLERAPRGRDLDGATRVRLGGRVARYAAIPLTAAAWLSVKSAAALGVAAGVATAGVVAVVERTVLAPETPSSTQPASDPKRSVSKRRSAAVPGQPATLHESVEPVEPILPSVPSAEFAPLEPARTAPPPSNLAPTPRGLAEESRLLEQARRALASTPAAALELTRQHAQRFPKAQLGAERSLLEVEALYRMGRRDQARALAERLLSRGTDDLYAERVRRLLAKIERGE